MNPAVLFSVSDSGYCVTNTLLSCFSDVFLGEGAAFFTLSLILSCYVVYPVHISQPWQQADAGCYEGRVLLGHITESLP